MKDIGTYGFITKGVSPKLIDVCYFVDLKKVVLIQHNLLKNILTSMNSEEDLKEKYEIDIMLKMTTSPFDNFQVSSTNVFK